MIVLPLSEAPKQAIQKRAYDKQTARLNRNPEITVHCQIISTDPDFPRFLKFPVRYNDSSNVILEGIRIQLPPIRYPHIVTTYGNNILCREPQELRHDSPLSVYLLMGLSQASTLSVRMKLIMPPAEKEPKAGIRSKLKSVFGLHTCEQSQRRIDGESRAGLGIAAPTDPPPRYSFHNRPWSSGKEG